ncbi:unnamed protein product [Bursaphelenchus okinawaensis]|uniref:Fatty-acid and retinol-binding protein 1 n=1 Tax=Bursaphelenchus okinawaensis TaxID=465554 RepID=A0A811L2G4_9BILA|nr:unnamed protein product [Bursaphelenchus okinawaensis]CAG9117426.1 unnamed protein product [Bursaphelenchus okinawaensis]
MKLMFLALILPAVGFCQSTENPEDQTIAGNQLDFLNEEEQQKVNEIFEQNQEKPRKDLRKALKVYSLSLPQDVQDKAHEARKDLDAKVKASKAKVKKLGKSLQYLLKRLDHFIKNDKLSLKKAKVLVGETLKNAKPELLKDYEEANLDDVYQRHEQQVFYFTTK